MIKDNTILHPDCGFEGDIAGFIYGELDTSAAKSVTLHLASCKRCSDDVAGLSDAVLAFRDWRSSDFETLSTPVIELPESQHRPTGKWSDIGAWFGFLLRPQGLVAASVFVVIAFVAAIYINSSHPAFETASMPVVESQSLVQSPAYLPDMSSPAVATTGDDNAASPARASASRREPPVKLLRGARAAVPPTPVATRHSRVSDIPVGNQYARKAVTVPEVVEKREIEDETLRLADLFSEVDAG